MVKIISISDEVYEDLSRMKNGKSFTELLKTLIIECTNKGDPKSILSFLEDSEPLNDSVAEAIQTATSRGRKNSTGRKSAAFA
jgi:predicted CopG family antitoxin